MVKLPSSPICTKYTQAGRLTENHALPLACRQKQGNVGLAGYPVCETSPAGRVKYKFEEECERLNEGFTKREMIKRFELLPNELSVNGGEGTPSLKVIAEKYKTQIAKINA